MAKVRIIRFSSFDNISRRHTSWIIRVFCVHSFRLIQYKREGKQLHFHISRHIAHLGWETPVSDMARNRGERYGAKYENGVVYLLSYTVSVENCGHRIHVLFMMYDVYW
jgi:hypothetical protein